LRSRKQLTAETITDDDLWETGKSSIVRRT